MHELLRSDSWDVRIAASQAIDAVASQSPQWNPSPKGKKEVRIKIEGITNADQGGSAHDDRQNVEPDDEPNTKTFLALANFNLGVIMRSKPLLANAGYDDSEEEDFDENADPRERLEQQRRYLEKKMGLLLDVGEMISEEDLVTAKKNSAPQKKDPSSLSIVNSSQKLSTRERAQMRRTAKLSAKTMDKERRLKASSGGMSTESLIAASSRTKISASPSPLSTSLESSQQTIDERDVDQDFSSAAIPVDKLKTSITSQNNSNKVVVEFTGPDSEKIFEDEDSWPFDFFCAILLNEIFEPQWEVRHGALLGLREILRHHGGSAGKSAEAESHEKMQQLHQMWIEDCCVRIFCLIALDQFNDYVGDSTVGPVRETAVQVLAVLLQQSDQDTCRQVLRIAKDFFQYQGEFESWQMPHNGLQIMKYLIAIRTDMIDELFGEALPILNSALSESNDDDVRGIAAESFLPIVVHLPQRLGREALADLLATLWKILDEMVDILSSSKFVMSLLADLYSCILHDSCPAEIGEHIISCLSLQDNVPRLFPFFYHNIRSVREAAINTLLRLVISSQKKSAVQPHLWLLPLLSRSLCHTFQAIILDDSEKDCMSSSSSSSSRKLWRALIEAIDPEELASSSTFQLTNWFSLISSPSQKSIEVNLLVPPTVRSVEQELSGRIGSKRKAAESNQSLPALKRRKNAKNSTSSIVTISVDEIDRTQFPILANDQVVSTALRVRGASAIGQLASHLPKEQHDFVFSVLLGSSAGNASKILSSCLVIAEWASASHSPLRYRRTRKPEIDLQKSSASKQIQQPSDAILTFPDIVHQAFLQLLETESSYCETQPIEAQIVADFKTLFESFMSHRAVAENALQGQEISVQLIDSVIRSTIPILLGNKNIPKQVVEQLESRSISLLHLIEVLQDSQKSLTRMVQAVAAETIIQWRMLPPKLNVIIHPLMGSIRQELDPILQRRSSETISLLCEQILGKKAPVARLIKNLCIYASTDEHFFPQILDPGAVPEENQFLEPPPLGSSSVGIDVLSLHSPPPLSSASSAPASLMLSNEETVKEEGDIIHLPNQEAVISSLKVRKGKSRSETLVTAESIQRQKSLKMQEISRVGAEKSLSCLAIHFGEDLFTKLPALWQETQIVVETAVDVSSSTVPYSPERMEKIRQLIESLHVISVIIPSAAKVEREKLISAIAGQLFELCRAGVVSAVRTMVARTIAICAKYSREFMMAGLIKNLLPSLGDSVKVHSRLGVAEVLYNTISKLDLDVVPYLVLLIVPALGRMSDHNEMVRKLVTRSFALLVRLMALENGVSDPPDMDKELCERKLLERGFLDQLFDPTKRESFQLSVPLQEASLRKYQQDGLNWLGFLNKYKLHGILCDDMGLGKTLQTLCMIASDNYERRSLFEKTGSPDTRPLPSLVVCPTTVVGHWHQEVQKFFGQHVSSMMFAGLPSERSSILADINRTDVVVVSYEILRNDIQELGAFFWNYCVLDEGHVIRNAKTKTTIAVKQIQANHRLILSGTPIQNNVLELWSLFDFLMPGFLGTEKQFSETFSKPILASRDAKSTQKEQEAGDEALQALHRQVLPFLLRRMKEDVLADLPPKIIQDYFCDLSPLQALLYDDIAPPSSSELAPVEGSSKGHHPHIFQALQYLRKLCAHPLLVFSERHPRYQEIMERVGTKKVQDLFDIHHSPKLVALQQLLFDCGIGQKSKLSLDDSFSSTASLSSFQLSSELTQHRVLVFCQLKGMLDIIERDLLKSKMPEVTYLRLDGATAAQKRQEIVNHFNRDPTIDLLLLTTQVGGLGLNLTGADTVIFVEHDWNPMKDLQAMDRAHRIGQKKVVNVYRLITRGTLEEKIMKYVIFIP